MSLSGSYFYSINTASGGKLIACINTSGEAGIVWSKSAACKTNVPLSMPEKYALRKSCINREVCCHFCGWSRAYLLRIAARLRSVGSKMRLRIRRLSGVTSRSSSTSIKSNACSRLRILGGTSVSASSAEEERVLVRCFFLQTFSSISSAREEEPMTMPAYTFCPGPIKSVPPAVGGCRM